MNEILLRVTHDLGFLIGHMKEAHAMCCRTAEEIILADAIEQLEKMNRVMVRLQEDAR